MQLSWSSLPAFPREASGAYPELLSPYAISSPVINQLPRLQGEGRQAARRDRFPVIRLDKMLPPARRSGRAALWAWATGAKLETRCFGSDRPDADLGDDGGVLRCGAKKTGRSKLLQPRPSRLSKYAGPCSQGARGALPPPEEGHIEPQVVGQVSSQGLFNLKGCIRRARMVFVL